MATGAVDGCSSKQQGDVAGAIEHWRDMQGDGLKNFAFQPALSWSCCDRWDDRLLRLRAGGLRLLDLLGNRGYRFLPNTGER
jgi:hypothetical protein